MPKAVLSNRIYMDLPNSDIMDMDQLLTYRIERMGGRGGMEVTIIKLLRRIKDNVVSIPIGRTDLIPAGYEIIDKRVTIEAEIKKMNFQLFDSQKEIYDDIDGNSIINAPVSWGKTFTGLAIAHKLGLKTLVVTHTLAIRSQWVTEHLKMFGTKPGIIGSGSMDYSQPITIGNTQTLHKHLNVLGKMFGTMIVDEVHRVPSKTFSSVVDASYARYKIGLSGTLERKDGKHVVLKDYFGTKVYTPKAENRLDPTIHIIKTPITFYDGAGIPWTLRINDLMANENYRNLVIRLAVEYADRGYKVLVSATRTYFLDFCAEQVGKRSISITGQVPFQERDELTDKINSGEIDIIFGSQQIFSEGISINPLSCLILACPINNNPLLEQLVGRVRRKMPGKLNPIVVDLNLKGTTARRQANGRTGFYYKEGFKIRTLEL